MTTTAAVRATEPESATIQEEIGTAAGAIWHVLATNGGCALPKLRKGIDCSTPVFDWAIGWLAREDKIAITREKRSFVIRLKETGS